MTGAATLVPPKTSQPLVPRFRVESNTATPVAGSATADTSATVRRAQPLSCCHAGLASKREQPEPAPDHAVSVEPRSLTKRRSEVPPTAVTKRDAAGYSTPKPASPEETVIAMPGWLKAPSDDVSVENSEPPNELEISVAPRRAAVFSAVARLANDDELPSTSRMWQFGQIAEAMSRSSEISWAQPVSTAGSGDAPPFWLTLRKQPLAVVHGGRPNWLR